MIRTTLLYPAFFISSEQSVREAILTAPIWSTLMALTKPMVIGIFAIMFFQVVDSWFIAQLGVVSLAANGFVQPVILVITNMAIGLGIALSAIVGRLIGLDDRLEVASTQGGATIFALGFGLLLSVISWLANPYLFELLGATPDVLPEIDSFWMFHWPFIPLLFVVMLHNAALRAAGNTKLPSISLLLGAILNALLDPLFIFGLGPFSGLGISGAPFATAISMLVVMIILLIHQRRRGALLFTQWSFKKHLLLGKRLLVLGAPAMLTNLMVPLSGAILLSWVSSIGVSEVAGFGVGMRMEPLLIVFILALTSVIPAFVAQNFAVQSYHRIFEVLHTAFRMLIIVQLIIFGLLLLVGRYTAGLFSDETDVINAAYHFFIWVPVGYFGMGIVLCINSAFNALQLPQYSMLLNLIRLLAFYLSGAYIGLQFGGYQGMLIGAATGNLLAGLICWWCLFKYQRLKLNALAG